MRLLRRSTHLPRLILFLFVVSSTSLFGARNSPIRRASDLIELAAFDDMKLVQALNQSAGAFRFEIDHDHLNAARAYEVLQSKIAGLISREFERPEVIIRFKMGNATPLSSSFDLGIVGGIGPLSDARILNQLIKKLVGLDFPGCLNISMLSLPPPRRLLDKLKYGIRYALKVARFSRKNSVFFLASNTAHVHWAGISCLAGARPRIHLPQEVVRLMSSNAMVAKSSGGAVLVLDTVLAYQKSVYQTALGRGNQPFIRLSLSEHQHLQKWINRIKTNDLQASEEDDLAVFVIGLAKKYQSSTILLACTELPLGLAASITDWRQSGYLVYDSERILVESILNCISERWA